MITPLDCQDLVELITDYLEGALSTADVREFEEHLDDCDGCTEYVAQMRTTIALTGRLATDDIQPTVVERLLDAFQRHHDAAG